MKKLYLLPFIAICPLMFMANSPAPSPNSGNYHDFTISDVLVEDDPEYSDHLLVSMTFNNTGEGIVSPYNMVLYHVDTIVELGYIQHSQNRNDCYYLPHQSYKLTGYLYDNVDADKIRLSCSKMSGDYVDISYSSIYLKETKSDSWNSIYTYVFGINDLKYDKNYTYNFVISYTYKGETLGQSFNNNPQFALRFNEQIDVEKDIVFNNIYAAKGYNKMVEEQNNLWILLWIVVAIVLSLGFFASLIVVPIVLFTKKPWIK